LQQVNGHDICLRNVTVSISVYNGDYSDNDPCSLTSKLRLIS